MILKRLFIDKLFSPLDNLPPTIGKITIKKSVNIYRKQNKIPYECMLTIENIEINNIDIFNNMKEENYLNITELYLNNNEITNILESIGSQINLQELCISYNQITSIPEYISLLVNLQTLKLYNN